MYSYRSYVYIMIIVIITIVEPTTVYSKKYVSFSLIAVVQRVLLLYVPIYILCLPIIKKDNCHLYSFFYSPVHHRGGDV